MTATLLLIIKASIFGLVLATGMHVSWKDLLDLWQRPRLLIRSFLAMYVLVPLTTFRLVKLLPMMNPGAKAALLVLAASAGAPLLPRKLARIGDGAYALSLVATSSLIAIILVPAWVAMLASYFGVATEISLLAVTKVVTMAFLFPLLLGMVSRGGDCPL